jgi:hypothetical protein
MPNMLNTAKSLAAFCPCKRFGLDEEQIKVMLSFEARFQADLKRVYKEIPDGTADKVIAEMLERVFKEMKSAGNL